MGLASLIPGRQKVYFQSEDYNKNIFQIDASLKETHTKKSTPTSFPIEDGTAISDHMIKNPFSLTLNGIISDTPIPGLDNIVQIATNVLTAKLLPPVGVIAVAGLQQASSFLTADSISQAQSPSQAAYLQLLSLLDSSTPVTVNTSLYRYKGMYVTDISIPRDSATGQAIIFDLTLTQLIIVQPQTVTIKQFANPDLAAGLADTGHQSAEASQYALGKAAGTATFNSTSSALSSVFPGGTVQ